MGCKKKASGEASRRSTRGRSIKGFAMLLYWVCRGFVDGVEWLEMRMRCDLVSGHLAQSSVKGERIKRVHARYGI